MNIWLKVSRCLLTALAHPATLYLVRMILSGESVIRKGKTCVSYISFEDVTKEYQMGGEKVLAANGVSFEMEQGELAVVLGPSGAGKTTILNLLGGMDKVTSGKIVVGGKEITGLSGRELTEYRRLDVGFVFQFYNLMPNLTALENVELPLIYRGLPAGKRRLLALEALERVGLASRMDHRPNQMSGGQQQRVAVARAIAAHPPLILADEPTGNLDTRAGAKVFEIIRALHAEGNTIVLITHDEGLARKAQRIVRITDGKIDDGEREVF